MPITDDLFDEELAQAECMTWDQNKEEALQRMIAETETFLIELFPVIQEEV